MDYRHELKFPVSDMELELIRYRLRPLMKQDIHQKQGMYTVRSLYFDDYYDSGMRENEDGIGNRQKFRIRIYNHDDSVIKLEKKEKYRGMVRKEGVFISREDCFSYMNGTVRKLCKDSPGTEMELYAQIKTRGMHPVSIVEYERTALVEPRGNVRITFDRNISGSNQVNNFMDERLAMVPLLPAGIHILEVKYDQLLPQYIYEALNMGTLQRSSFSKYYYSRTKFIF
ncbi:MAG: polyphosphate polymerase domain-containing protein [Bacillota bacterium]|nr:polyphosphate polymerase domain-containing protein [Bacillota bacterium]